MLEGLFHLPYELFLAKKAFVAFNEVKNCGYLKKGKYKLHLYGKPIVYNINVGEIKDKYPAKYFCFFNKIILNNKSNLKKIFQADYIMVLSEGEYKLFDLTNKLIYTKISENKKKIIISGQKRFKDFFNTTIIGEDDEGIFEKYIDYIPSFKFRSEDRILLLEEIFYSYIYYARYCHDSNIISDQMSLKQIISLCNSQLCDYTKKLIKCISENFHIPSIYQHGDMHFGNILNDGKKTYLIDFERYSKDLFFYDILNCCYVEAVDNGKWDLIEWYISNETNSNSLLDMLFSEMGVKFDSKKKRDYFALFMLRRLYADSLRASKGKTKNNFDYILKKNRVILKWLEEQA